MVDEPSSGVDPTPGHVSHVDETDAFQTREQLGRRFHAAFTSVAFAMVRRRRTERHWKSVRPGT